MKNNTEYIVGVCVKYEVKLAKNNSEYADITIRDKEGKIYLCKLWNWNENLAPHLVPYQNVLSIIAQKQDFQGNEQYIIKEINLCSDVNISDYVYGYIDTQKQLQDYKDFINSELSLESPWLKIINQIINDHEIILLNGIVDSRPGANINGTLLKSILNVSKMARSIAQQLTLPINYGYMYYVALMAILSKGRMFFINNLGQIEQSDDTSFFGYVGLPTLYIQKLFSKEEFKNISDRTKLLAIHGVLSNVSSNEVGFYPPVVNNTPEGRIVYHCIVIDYSTSIMEFYFGDKTISICSIPELNEKIKFILPSRYEDLGKIQENYSVNISNNETKVNEEFSSIEE